MTHTIDIAVRVIFWAYNVPMFALHVTRRHEQSENLTARFGWISPAAFMWWAISKNVDGDHVSAALDTALAAFAAWAWWNDSRKRRQRRANRVTGIVSDLGHRLTVVPVKGNA